MIWLILLAIYLLIGFFFKKPEEWDVLTKVLVHIFWLPIVVFIIIIIRLGGARII
jgi:hypothetical protein